jgi:hypothetical protein
MIVIDPSSGKTGEAGWAEFVAGTPTSWGTISIPFNKVAFKRFNSLGQILLEDFPEDYDVLMIELLKGRYAKLVLKQSAAVFGACLKWDKVMMIAPRSWQAIADRLGGWIKRDDVDAVYMGYSAIAFAHDYDPKWKREAQVAFLKELAEIYKWKLGEWE